MSRGYVTHENNELTAAVSWPGEAAPTREERRVRITALGAVRSSCAHPAFYRMPRLYPPVVVWWSCVLYRTMLPHLRRSSPPPPFFFPLYSRLHLVLPLFCRRNFRHLNETVDTVLLAGRLFRP